MIAEFLDIEQHLKRRFREDSITDILIASLLSLPGKDVVVLTPPEAKTGGDFDLIVVEPASGDAVQFRIQAKRLTPHEYNWTIGCYAELAHPHNNGKQSKSLVGGVSREGIPTIPLYAFYNPAHVCFASGGMVSGIELASGWEVRERVKTIVRVKPKRLPFKRIGSLQPLFFPLTTILCPPRAGGSIAAIPRPAEARAAVEAAIDMRRSLDGYGPTQRISTKPALRLPRELHDDFSYKRYRQRRRSIYEPNLPKIIRTAIERREEKVRKANVKRPRVVLISESKEN